MDLKALLGDSYKDGMTIDEINAALAGKNFVDPTTLPPSVSKEQFDRTASEAARYKKELSEAKAAGLTDAEKLKKLQEEAIEAQRNFTLKSNRMDVEKVLIAAGLAEADYAPFIDTIVTESAESSKAAAEGIAKMLKNNGIDLQLTPKAIDLIASEGFDPQFGARPIKRALQRLLLNELSGKIIARAIDKEKPILVDEQDGKLVFENEGLK